MPNNVISFKIELKMDKYTVFGSPIKQSKSPFIHQAFAKQTSQAIEYTAIEPALDNFQAEVKKLIQLGGKGCNVTMPFKEQAYQMATTLSERAQLAGAVNTLTFADDGSVLGDNTDGAGLVADLKANNAPLTKRVLLIGAGGAARGVIKPLLDCQPNSLTIVNRTFEKAQALTAIFQPFGNIKAVPIEALEDEQPFDLVINSTSTSLTDELPPVSSNIFANECFAYDMVYKANKTTFLAWAAKNGAAITIDGLGMLVGQAAESFYVWRNVMPTQSNVLAQLRIALGKE